MINTPPNIYCSKEFVIFEVLTQHLISQERNSLLITYTAMDSANPMEFSLKYLTSICASILQYKIGHFKRDKELNAAYLSPVARSLFITQA